MADVHHSITFIHYEETFEVDYSWSNGVLCLHRLFAVDEDGHLDPRNLGDERLYEAAEQAILNQKAETL